MASKHNDEVTARIDAIGSSAPSRKAHEMNMRLNESQRPTVTTGTTSRESGLDDLTGPFALFIKGREALGQRRRGLADSPILHAAELLERNAASLMLIGRDLESASLNEEIVRRYSRLPKTHGYVARAHFNAGCAFLRIGLIDRAMHHFAALVDDPDILDQEPLLPLACEGLHQGELAMERMRIHEQQMCGYTGS